MTTLGATHFFLAAITRLETSMSLSLPIVILISISAVLAGAIVAWLILQAKSARIGTRLEEREKEVVSIRADLAAARETVAKAAQERERMAGMLEAERAGFAEKTALLV